MKNIIDDSRRIEAVTNDSVGSAIYWVGDDDECVRIVAYGEPGDGALKPAVEVYRKGDAADEPSVRLILGAGMAVHYLPKDGDHE